jgi:glycosyltransferase involved in cell wall biosynthesis
MKIALCPHLSLEHYRGGEKWTAALANRLAADGVDVSVRALPYTPNDRRRVAASEVLDPSVSYREQWRHDLSTFDTAYIFYNPFCRLFFTGETRSIAGIHSWAYVSDRLYEPYYGVIPTAVKALYRAVGARELSGFDAVHTVTDVFESPHPNMHHVPNFVDTERFHPDRVPEAEEFTVLVTAAHLPAKGWNITRQVARTLHGEAEILATGSSDDEYVTELGFLDEDALADAYSNAHVVLHPTQIDADSLVIKEALASGTPVVTTPLSTHPPEGDAILHGTTVGDIVARIRTLRWDWMNGGKYEDRCQKARAEGEKYGFNTLYPKLKELLFSVELNNNGNVAPYFNNE